MAMRPLQNVQYIDPVNSNSRVPRKPQHRFQIECRPWQIQPFCLAPVLPGETLNNILMQARVVTDPIKNPLIGWHQEFYWFYVRHRDMPLSADLQAMMLDPADNIAASGVGATDVDHYVYQGGIDWAAQCLEPVVKYYFRTPDEVQDGTWDDYKLGDLHLAAVTTSETWMDSLVDATVLTDGAALPDDVDNATVGDVDRLTTYYQFLRDSQLTDMGYEDWLRTYGVKLPQAEQPGIPELLRYEKAWQYPSNTVDPATGIPASAVSWAVSMRADKKRFFKEPGFIFGVCVSRPKVYFSKQVGSAVGMMNDAFSWLPALLQDKPEISLKEFAADTGPLFGNTTNGYWVDIRDIFVYGDQFTNIVLTETDSNFVALPTAALQKRYASSTDADNLFKAASPANKVRMDGVAHFMINGRQVDMT